MNHTARENSALVRRFLLDIVSGGDTDAIDLLVTEDVAEHGLLSEDSQDLEPLKSFGWRALADSDVSVTVGDVVAGPNQVAVRSTITGTHREHWMGLQPTENEFEIPCVWFCRINGGRITEIWSLPDGFGLLQQLDIIPTTSENNPDHNQET